MPYDIAVAICAESKKVTWDMTTSIIYGYFFEISLEYPKKLLCLPHVKYEKEIKDDTP